jgi:hypothetical protein
MNISAIDEQKEEKKTHPDQLLCYFIFRMG